MLFKQQYLHIQQLLEQLDAVHPFRFYFFSYIYLQDRQQINMQNLFQKIPQQNQSRLQQRKEDLLLQQWL